MPSPALSPRSSSGFATRIARRAFFSASLAVGFAGGYFATAQMPASRAADLRLPESQNLTNKRRDALVEIVERVKGCVVNIHSERTLNQADDPLRSGLLQPQRVKGMGTGIVLDPRGYIVTNYHVIDEVQMLRVALVDGKTIPARVIATDRKADLALLKIETTSPLTVVSLGTANDLLDAEQVIAIGNAFGYEHTVSIGNIAFKSRDVSLNKEISYQGLIQTTAPINPGNSGGPLFNKKGELIGVNVAIHAKAQNIAFAIPVDTMIERAAEMMSGKRRAGFRHGIVAQDHAIRPTEESTVEHTVIVRQIEPNSPAALAGLKIGDVIEQIDDLNTETTIDIERGFFDKTNGAKLPIRVRRGEDVIRTSLVFQMSDSAVSVGSPVETVWRRVGFTANPVGKDLLSRVDGQLRGGMIVNEIATGSPAAKAGLQKGDLLIGFHLWEAMNHENIVYVLNHKDAPTFTPLKTYFIRDGKIRETYLTPGE